MGSVLLLVGPHVVDVVLTLLLTFGGRLGAVGLVRADTGEFLSCAAAFSLVLPLILFALFWVSTWHVVS